MSTVSSDVGKLTKSGLHTIIYSTCTLYISPHHQSTTTAHVHVHVHVCIHVYTCTMHHAHYYIIPHPSHPHPNGVGNGLQHFDELGMTVATDVEVPTKRLLVGGHNLVDGDARVGTATKQLCHLKCKHSQRFEGDKSLGPCTLNLRGQRAQQGSKGTVVPIQTCTKPQTQFVHLVFIIIYTCIGRHTCTICTVGQTSTHECGYVLKSPPTSQACPPAS